MDVLEKAKQLHNVDFLAIVGHQFKKDLKVLVRPFDLIDPLVFLKLVLSFLLELSLCGSFLH